MKWSRAKTILIYLLLGVNIAFGVNLFAARTQSRRTERQAAADAAEILREDGIEINHEIVPLSGENYEITVMRNAKAEEQAAIHLTGSDKAEQLDDGTTRYGSDSGQTVFKDGGFFEISLFNGGYKAGDKAEAKKQIVKILNTVGISLRGQRIETSEDLENGKITVSIYQKAGDKDVYNGGISAVFDEDTVEITGRWTDYDKGKKGRRAKGAGELLLKLGEVLKADGAAERITADNIKKGYMISNDGNIIYLTPVWRVEYNNDKTVYLNMITGEQASVS